METREVVVIGGGPSGFTAGIYLARADMRPLIVAGEKKGGQLMYTTEVENYPGFVDGINGPDLMFKMEEQAKRFGARILNKNVTKVELTGKIKKIWMGEEVVEAKAVIVSTGASSRMLGVGEEKLMGRGVSTCAVCDAAFFRNKRTTVVGGGDAAMEDALALAKFAESVDLIHRKTSFRASKIMVERVVSNKKINVMWESEVVGVSGEQKLETIKIKKVGSDKEVEIKMDGLFLAIGHMPVTEIFKDQVELNEKGYVMTTMTGVMRESKWRVSESDYWLNGYPTLTSVEGVFAAGDVVDYRYRQAITAAGMGCQAALDVEKFLTGQTASW